MKKIIGNSYYFPSQVVIGGYKVNKQLVLIDSGNDDSSVRKAIRDFDAVKVIALLNTHSHADHCGGNAYIQKQFDAPIYAPAIEKSFIEDPILEPTYLYGAYPLKSLQNKFLMAKSSAVKYVLEDDAPININFEDGPHTFTPISLKGHSPNQFGYMTPDGIAYLGDSLISSEMVLKHPLLFTYDVTEHLNTLEKLKSVSAEGYVISHGGYYETIDALIDTNTHAMEKTLEHILKYASQSPLTFDDLHHKLGVVYNLTENISQNLLNRSVIHAHVRHLVDLGELEIYTESSKLVLNKTSGFNRL